MLGELQVSPFRWVYPLNFDDHGGVGDLRNNEISLVPELITLGHQKYTEAYPLKLHHHEDCYEFVFVEQGSVTWEMNGKLYPTHAGQWFYTCPGELHRARFNYLEPSRIWWFIIKDPSGTSPHWFQMEANDREFIMDQLRQLPRVFHAGNRIRVREQFERLRVTLESKGPQIKLFARHQILDILLGLLQPGASKKIEPELKETVIRVVNQMEQTPEKRHTVADMARAAQFSESHFYKIFHEIFGQSPASYMEHVRIKRACELLKTEISITEAAFELGFKTSQHFAKVFKKQVGSSPSEWRRQLL